MTQTIVVLVGLLLFVLGYARGVMSERRRQEVARRGYVDVGSGLRRG